MASSVMTMAEKAPDGLHERLAYPLELPSPRHQTIEPMSSPMVDRGKLLSEAKAQFKIGAYGRALDIAVKAASAESHQWPYLKDCLHLAAQSSLLMSSPSRALKYASRLVFMDPQDPSARSLVRMCTLEMEYEAHTLALQEDCFTGANSLVQQDDSTAVSATEQHARIHRLLEQLRADEQRCLQGSTGSDVGSILDQLTLEASQSVDSQIAFTLASGYSTVMNLFVTAPQQVEELLLAVGSCQLYQARSRIPTDAAAGLVRIRWPQIVLQRLTTTALNWRHQSDLASRSMGLLAFAAQDKLQRHTGFMAHPSWQPTWSISPCASIPSLVHYASSELASAQSQLHWLGSEAASIHSVQTQQTLPWNSTDLRAELAAELPSSQVWAAPTAVITGFGQELTDSQITSEAADSPMALSYQTCPAALGQLLSSAQQAVCSPETPQACPQRVGSWSEPGLLARKILEGDLENKVSAQAGSAAGALSISGCEAVASAISMSAASERGMCLPLSVTVEPFSSQAVQAQLLGECASAGTASPRHRLLMVMPTHNGQHRATLYGHGMPGQESMLQNEQLSLEYWKIQEQQCSSKNDLQAAEQSGSSSAVSINECLTPVKAPNPCMQGMASPDNPIEQPLHWSSQPTADYHCSGASPANPTANGDDAALPIAHVLNIEHMEAMTLEATYAYEGRDSMQRVGETLPLKLISGSIVVDRDLRLPSQESVMVRLMAGLSRTMNTDQHGQLTGDSKGAPAAAMLPLSAACCAVLIMHSFCADSHSVALLAATEQALSTLLALYQVLHTTLPASPTQRAALFSDPNLSTACAWGVQELASNTGCTMPCCGAARLVLTAMSHVCSAAPTVAVKECFLPDVSTASRADIADGGGIGGLCKGHSSVSLASMSSRGSRPSGSVFGNLASPRPTATPLLSTCVQLAKALVSSSQPAVQPELGWDGTVKGYAQGKWAHDPCILNPSSSPRLPNHTGDAQHLAALGPAATPVHAWMQVFGSLASTGRPVARELFRAGLTDVLQDVVQQFRGDDQLVQVVEHAWGNVCSTCGLAVEELLDDGYMHGLIAVAMRGLQRVIGHWQDLVQRTHTRHSSVDCSLLPPLPLLVPIPTLGPRQQRALHHSMSIALQALDKLAQILNQCNGSDFVQLTRHGGLLPLVHWLLVRRRHANPAYPSVPDGQHDTPPGSSPPSSFPRRTAPSTTIHRPSFGSGPLSGPLSVGRFSRPMLPGLPTTVSPPSILQQWPMSPRGSISGILSSFAQQHQGADGPISTPLPPRSEQRSPGAILRSYSSQKRQPIGQTPPHLAACIEMLPSLCDAGRCVLLGCLERARRAAGMSPSQVPRIGWFGEMCPKELLVLEQTLRAQWADALLPKSNASSAPSTPPRLGEKQFRDAFSGQWTPTASATAKNLADSPSDNLHPALDVEPEAWTSVNEKGVLSATQLDTPSLGHCAGAHWTNLGQAQSTITDEVSIDELQPEASITLGIAASILMTLNNSNNNNNVDDDDGKQDAESV